MALWKIESLTDIPLPHEGTTILLITPEELEHMPDGSLLLSILGVEVIKGEDYIDGDTRAGYLAYGTPVAW